MSNVFSVVYSGHKETLSGVGPETFKKKMILGHTSMHACMYVCIYVCVYQVFACLYVQCVCEWMYDIAWMSCNDIYSYTHTCRNAYKHTYMYTRTCIICTHNCIHTCIHTCTHIHTYLHTCILTYMHVYMHAYIHT